MIGIPFVAPGFSPWNEKISNEKRIELAKSWFVLAQISIILAGFMFASAEIFQNKVDSVDDVTIDALMQFQINNISEDFINKQYTDAIVEILLDRQQKNVLLYSNTIGWVKFLVFLSILFWLIGRGHISKIK